MSDFESLVVLLLLAVLLAAAARRVGAPYPVFLALGGVLLAFIPGAPRFVLRPDLALALFVAPVLLDAAYDASPRDLRDSWAALMGLVVVAVGLTTLAVAWIARVIEPDMPWAAAIALGAIVAPPDAAAAVAVLRTVSLPHRIMTILEGESLLNDATALLIYRLAVGVALTNGFSIQSAGPALLLALVGSVVVGPALAWLTMRLTQNVHDIPSAIILQFISTFGVWIIAERLHLSSVLTMVCYAIAVARPASERMPARVRVPSYAVWDTAVFVLNVFAFVLIGMQIRPILDGLEPETRTRYFDFVGAVLLTAILVRVVWVMAYVAVVRLKIRVFGFHPPRPTLPPSARGGIVVAWSGMRGVVTLATALALPAAANGEPFPFRGLIVLTAFSIVLGTLVIQGLTLKPLLRLLDVRDDDPVAREVELARSRALRAVFSVVEGKTGPAADLVRQEYSALLQDEADARRDASVALAPHDLRARALAAARRAVLDMRANDEIGDDAFHRVEEDLDRMEFGTLPQ